MQGMQQGVLLGLFQHHCAEFGNLIYTMDLGISG